MEKGWKRDGELGNLRLDFRSLGVGPEVRTLWNVGVLEELAFGEGPVVPGEP